MDRVTGRPPKLPAFVLGLGLGGFLDGIVLYQCATDTPLVSDTGDNPIDTVAGPEITRRPTACSTWLPGRLWRLGWCSRSAPGSGANWRQRGGHTLVSCSPAGASRSRRGSRRRQLLGIHHVQNDIGAPLGWDLGFLAFGIVWS